MALVAFDFDGTLADAEVIDRLADRAGSGQAVATITRQAMNDEVAYAQSLRKRAALLEGLSVEEVLAVYEGIELRPGAGELLSALDRAGHTTAILSGGFEPAIETALETAGAPVDLIVANELPATDGALTGLVSGSLVEGTKDDALADICATRGFALQDVTAVGDGANDGPMMQVAGLAIGFDPKPAVEPVCDVVVTDIPALRSVFEAKGLLPRGAFSRGADCRTWQR